MSVDYKWMSNGGMLLDGTGDIAFTGSQLECAISMIRTRLKAAVDGWKLYRIGAGLNDFIGNTSNAEAEVSIKRRVLATLSKSYLPVSLFDVETLRFGNEIQVFVYLNKQFAAQAVVNLTPITTVV